MVRLWTLNSEIEVRILSTEPFPMPVTPLPNGQARDCKSRYPGSNPGGVSIFPSSSVVRATSLISRMSPVRIQPGEPGFVCCQDYQLETGVAGMLQQVQIFPTLNCFYPPASLIRVKCQRNSCLSDTAPSRSTMFIRQQCSMGRCWQLQTEYSPHP